MDEWLAATAAACARAAGVPAEALGDFPHQLLSAAVSGRRPDREQLRQITDLGRRAAERGVGADAVVNLYLSLAARLWRDLPTQSRSSRAAEVHAAAEAVLASTTDAVATLLRAHQEARQQLIRHEQTSRQEFLDDLLRGDADVARMVQRAEPFGLDLTAAHHVALAAPTRSRADIDRAALGAERPIVDAFGDREVLVGTKDGHIVVIVPGTSDERPESSDQTQSAARRIQACIERATRRPGAWRVVAGRAFAGYFGVARSYEEARDSLQLADRLGVATSALNPGQLLVHRVIGRDQAATVDLVRTVLLPLQAARGGAQPLVDTLRAYFDCARIATDTARELHVSVRTVTYRLDRVRQLTGYRPTDAQDGFVLQAAVHGALLLQWPAQPLPAASN